MNIPSRKDIRNTLLLYLRHPAEAVWITLSCIYVMILLRIYYPERST